jgi:hypothetical protein
LPQLLRHGARHVLSGSGRQNLATRVEGGPRVPRGTLCLNHCRWRSGCHRRRDNSQLPPIQPYIMILVKDLVFKQKNLLTNKIISDTDVYVEVDNTCCRPVHSRRRRLPSSFHGPARGWLARTRSGSLRTRRCLAVPEAGQFRSWHGLLLPRAAAFTLPAPSSPRA